MSLHSSVTHDDNNWPEVARNFYCFITDKYICINLLSIMTGNVNRRLKGGSEWDVDMIIICQYYDTDCDESQFLFPLWFVDPSL